MRVYGKLEQLEPVMLDLTPPEKGVGMGNSLGHRFWGCAQLAECSILADSQFSSPVRWEQGKAGIRGWEAEQLPVNKAPLTIPSAGKEKRFNLFHFLILSDVLENSGERADTSGTLKSTEVCGASKGHSRPVYRSECPAGMPGNGDVCG